MRPLSSVFSRLLPAALLLALGLLAGCTQRGVPQNSGIVNGAYSMALVKDLLFITSSDNNELRVLDLAVAPPRDFVRAPNPLSPLSIPVVARPVGLVRDVHYDETGGEVGGPFVYAFSSAVPSISVVGADRSILKELRQIPTGGPVSAVSAHGPDSSSPNSRLYYATAEGNAGKLWSIELSGAETVATQSLQPQLLLTLDPGEFVSALTVMPSINQVIVGVRSQNGKGGRTFLYDTQYQVQKPMKFPWPVRALATHPRADLGNGLTLAEGTRVFGVLDEESCGAGSGCQGILSVETDSGEVSLDVTGHTMLPITMGRALINGLSFARSGLVNNNSANGTAVVFELLGLGTDSAGEIFFFDAFRLRHINSNPNPAGLSGQTLQDANATAQTATANTGVIQASVQVAEGAVRDETVFVVREGLIGGLIAQPANPANGQRFPTSSSSLRFVVPGDTIVLAGPSTDCTAELTVSSVELPTTPGGPGALVTADNLGALPAACADYNAFSVRAGRSTPEPYVVSGSSTGVMGRVGPNEGFRYPATEAETAAAYFYHPDSYNPVQPMISFNMGPEDPNIQRGWSYLLVTTSGFLPTDLTIDTTLYPAFLLPGAILQIPDQPTAFVSYPSANSVVEFTPALIIPNQANNRNLQPYP